jgi:transposase-like protein
MTRKKTKRSLQEIKELIAEEEDILRPLIGAVLQEVAEMSQALGAEKGERIEGRLGYRSGYYVRSLITRVGRVELRAPKIAKGVSRANSLSVINAVKKPWWAPWPRCTSRGSVPVKLKPSPKSYAVMNLAPRPSAPSITIG